MTEEEALALAAGGRMSPANVPPPPAEPPLPPGAIAMPSAGSPPIDYAGPTDHSSLDASQDAAASGPAGSYFKNVDGTPMPKSKQLDLDVLHNGGILDVNSGIPSLFKGDPNADPGDPKWAEWRKMSREETDEGGVKPPPGTKPGFIGPPTASDRDERTAAAKAALGRASGNTTGRSSGIGQGGSPGDLRNLPSNLTADMVDGRMVVTDKATGKPVPWSTMSVRDKSRYAMDQYNRGPTEMKKAVTSAANLEIQANDAMTKLYAESAQASEHRRLQAEAHEQTRRVAADEQLAQIKAASAEVAKAQLTGGGFIERNPGAILQGIGAVLGGMLSARTGGPNTAMQGLENAIQRDLDIQKYNLEKKSENFRNQNTIYAQMREKFSDERTAARASEIAMREGVSAQMATLQSKASSETMKGNLGVMQERFNAQTRKLEADFWNQAYTNSLPRLGAGVGKPNKNTDPKLYVPALRGYARSAEHATDLIKKSAALQQIADNTRKAAQLRKDLSLSDMLSDKVVRNEKFAELKSLIEETKPLISVAAGQGAAGEQESSRYAAAMGNLTDLTGTPWKTAEAYAARQEHNLGELGKQFGVTPGEEGTVVDPTTGHTEIRGEMTADPRHAASIYKNVSRKPIE